MKILSTLPLYALLFSEKAEVFLCKGNERCREKDFGDAIRLYTEGIEVNCKDDEVKAKLLSNRAKAYFGLGELWLHPFLTGMGGSTCSSFGGGSMCCMSLIGFGIEVESVFVFVSLFFGGGLGGSPNFFFRGERRVDDLEHLIGLEICACMSHFCE